MSVVLAAPSRVILWQPQPTNASVFQGNAFTGYSHQQALQVPYGSLWNRSGRLHSGVHKTQKAM